MTDVRELVASGQRVPLVLAPGEETPYNVREAGDPPCFLLQASTVYQGGVLPDGVWQRVPIGALGQVLTVQADGSVNWQNSAAGFGNPMTTLGDLIDAAGGGVPQRLAVGANGQVLTVVSGVPAWAVPASGFSNPMTTLGDVITGGVAGAAQRLGIGATNQVLTVVGGVPAWANSAAGFANPMTTAGDIIFENATPAPARLAIGTAGQVLTVSGGLPTWQNNAAGFANPMTTLGDIITAAGGGAAQRLAAGLAGQVLGISAGVPAWINNPTGFANPMTAAGDLITGATGGAAQRLGVGGAGTVLTVVGGAPAWQAPTGIQILQPSGDTTGATDVVSINNAINALPTRILDSSPLITTALGRIRLGPGNWYINATVNVPPWVIIEGSGPGTFINSLVNGDTFFQQNTVPSFGAGPPLFGNVFAGYSGGFRDLLIDGTSAGANGVGIHTDSLPERAIIDGVIIQNFTGANAIGLRLSNSISFTENYRIRAFSTNNTLGCKMEKLSGGSESFRYCDFWLHVVAEQGQSGMVMQGIRMVMSTFRLTGNYASSTSAGPAGWSHLNLTATGVGGTFASFQSCIILIGGEIDLANTFVPQSIIMAGASNTITQCTGIMDFTGGFALATVNATLSMLGTIAGGDTVLQAANTIPSAANFNGMNTSVPPSVSTPAVAASGVAVTNTTIYDVMAYVNGTITAATKINGTAVGDTSVKSYYVASGATITLTYSSAPAWVWLAV